MKRHILLISNSIIILSIVIGFIGMVYTDTKTYQSLSEEHLESTLTLADIDISKQIENSMSRPVMVSKTMANDEFLKAWLIKEKNDSISNNELDQLYSYLKTYQRKYGYTTVFCISSSTGNYYYQDGFNKTISSEDPHDVWYYNFVESGQEYDLEVDTNQSNNDTITVFVNFRVESETGELLGIIGVGLQVSYIEDTIRTYEQDYDLSVYIINEGGAKTSFRGDTDIFINRSELAARTKITDDIELNRSPQSNIQWFTSNKERRCLITKYDETLGWYLILEKETNSIVSSFQERIKSNIIYMLVSLALCIVVTSLVFFNYNQRIVAMENIDELTGLFNNKMFYQQYSKFMRKNQSKPKTMFMFDIDHFKTINDTYGHLFGNVVLSMVGEKLQEATREHGLTARWGGDEFLGVLAVDTEKAKKLLTNYMDEIKNEVDFRQYHITISVGMIDLNEKLNMDQMVKKVDQALYQSKENGRDQITIL